MRAGEVCVQVEKIVDERFDPDNNVSPFAKSKWKCASCDNAGVVCGGEKNVCDGVRNREEREDGDNGGQRSTTNNSNNNSVPIRARVSKLSLTHSNISTDALCQRVLSLPHIKHIIFERCIGVDYQAFFQTLTSSKFGHLLHDFAIDIVSLSQKQAVCALVELCVHTPSVHKLSLKLDPDSPTRFSFGQAEDERVTAIKNGLRERGLLDERFDVSDLLFPGPLDGGTNSKPLNDVNDNKGKGFFACLDEQAAKEEEKKEEEEAGKAMLTLAFMGGLAGRAFMGRLANRAVMGRLVKVDAFDYFLRDQERVLNMSIE